MRLIDADRLKTYFPDNREGSWTYNISAKAYIDAQATIMDAVQVVRCKDCKHRPTKEKSSTRCPCSTTGDPFLDWIPEGDWFCANGEERR